MVILSQQLVIDQRRCRCLASNSSCWPDALVWQSFNETIDGRLLSSEPSAVVCNEKPYNAEACALAIAQWSNSTWRSDQAGALQNHNWENSSCSIFTNSTTCNQGSVSVFAVNATLPEHVQKTVRFAATNNFRLVIKSTGHDYLGRSTAAGSLLLWLHHMKTMTLIEQYSSCGHASVSNAARIGAGVQWSEVYRWPNEFNLTAIGGASSTVSVAGGYMLSGGHSPLSRWKGMAADQVLEYDVITADGQRQTVSICQNSDLFWALNGGGDGTYAAVLSVILRTFPSPTIVAAIYDVTTPNETRYRRLTEDFIRLLPVVADASWSGYFSMLDMRLSGVFHVPNGNVTVVNDTLNQFAVNNSDLDFGKTSIFTVPSFYDYFTLILDPSNPTGFNVLLSSRLIRESIVRNLPEKVAEVFAQVRGQSVTGSILLGHIEAGGQISNTSNTNNSVNPGWRTALLHMVNFQGWLDTTSEDIKEYLAKEVTSRTDILDPLLFGSQPSCYTNEADPNERKQLPDEPITFYYGDIINLCLEIDSNISEKIIIQHLMSRINPDFRKELLRRESSINTLNEFLKYAKIERDSHDRIRNLSIASQQLYSNFNRPSIPSLTATVNPPKQYYHKIKHNNPSSHSTQLQSSVSRRNSVPALGNRTSTIHNTKQIQNYTSQSTLKQNPINTGSTSQHQFNNFLPQGIANGPATFQRVIYHMLGPTRWKYALAYIDDVNIYSKKKFEEHLSHLNEICQILKNTRFRLNPEKCEIARTQTDYLGHRIQNGEIRPSLTNIHGLINTRLSQTTDEACKFVKAAEYYRKFILNFSQISEPLRKFVPTTRTQQSKGQKTIITLTNDEIKAFQQLKNFLTTYLILRLPNDRFLFKVQTDASDEGIGAGGIKFTWETDYKALTQLNQKAQLNKRCERWRLKILEYDFKVKYIPDSINLIPDYLSRSPVEDAEEDPDEITYVTSQSTQTDFEFHNPYFPVITVVDTRSSKLRNTILDNSTNTSKFSIRFSNERESNYYSCSTEPLIQAQKNDDYAKNIIQNIKKHKQYFIKNNILMRRLNPLVPYVPQGELRRTILKIYHDTAPNDAHFRKDKIIYKIKTCYF
ncbi:unnamed protein product [Rotaria sordida]|uniref:FAD-binding PCMH-type domain-containing protein n=1 Tax=Rotaria sordida TaxID=392033 RepID=A0A815AVH7_9BILA|nr:unnamed protein product [Rotaria sordida]